VVSQFLRRQTFKLDRFSGRVWQKVVDDKDNPSWEETIVESRPKQVSPGHPHFQIFLSGYMAKDTFLIDTDTGDTWQLVVDTQTDKDGKEVGRTYLWERMKLD
jgi:hypothetical protein